MIQPIDSIQWIESSKLKANDYNPNVVFNKELELLELSILTNGWIQPLLITQNYEIIDGFHRYSLSRMSQKVRELTDGKVPCAMLDLTEPERMMLTVRINRAKGSHIALKMSELVKTLIQDYNLSVDAVCKGLGATKQEVELLLMDDVFKKLDTQNHKYSKAWVPA